MSPGALQLVLRIGPELSARAPPASLSVSVPCCESPSQSFPPPLQTSFFCFCGPHGRELGPCHSGGHMEQSQHFRRSWMPLCSNWKKKFFKVLIALVLFFFINWPQIILPFNFELHIGRGFYIFILGATNVCLKNFFIFNWRIIASQCCVGFCHTTVWIISQHTYILSFLSLPPPPTSFPYLLPPTPLPAPNSCGMTPVGPGRVTFTPAPP